jgi:hypothetical protein
VTWVDSAPTEVSPTPTPMPWFTPPAPPQAPPTYAAAPHPHEDLFPREHRRRTLRDHGRVIAVVGAVAVVAVFVAFSAARESVLNHARANLATSQRSLTTAKSSLTSTQTTLTATQSTLAATQSTLSDTQSQLKTATAAAAQAQSDLAAVQSQLSTAQAGTAACKTFVGDADADIGLQAEFTTALGNGYDALLNGGDAQPFVDETTNLNNQIKALGVHYNADKAACLGGGSVGAGGSSNA